MITRRQAVAGFAGSLLLAKGGACGAAEPTQTSADELVALPGKKPLIRRTFRPPNFETPIADLRQPFTANDAFFVRYHVAQLPEIDPRTWRLRVGGSSAGRTLDLSLDDLQRSFERVSIPAVNQCSGNRRGLFSPRVPGVQWRNGAIGNARWTGVRVRDVLRRAGVNSNALEVVFDGADAGLLSTPDYMKSLPIDLALNENTLIAFEMNDQVLLHWHGAPARLVVPGWTATYWIKHLTTIRIEPQTFDGFWMKSAYRIPTGAFPGARFATQETAETTPITEILVNSLVTSHESGARVARGQPLEISGWAWDGGSGIAAVDVSQDGGQSWLPSVLERDLGRFAWRGFRARVDTSRPTQLDVLVRAASRSGARQPERLTPNPSGYHHNMIQTVSLEVA
jgi:DMSO/TMAO reductase YedYZ molybdopterin-dependent catalytic subunit